MTELDLSPHDSGRSGAGVRRLAGYPIRNVVVVGALVVVLGFVLFQAVTSARVFFYNVDEAVERRAELAGRTFQMQGTVVADSGVDEVGALVFDISFGGETAAVRHLGDEPSNLFRVGEQVVVEGHWEGEEFHSRQILIKHSEEYVEDNPDRVDYELDPDRDPAADPAEPSDDASVNDGS